MAGEPVAAGTSVEGGTPAGAGTPAEGGTAQVTPQLSAEEVQEIIAERDRLKQAHEQDLGEKGRIADLERKIAELQGARTSTGQADPREQIRQLEWQARNAETLEERTAAAAQLGSVAVQALF